MRELRKETITIQDVTMLIIESLKAQGLVVQRYDAYSTDSVYLKLDYGVCNSIRISDHRGKQHLAYRYNVEQGCQQVQSVTDGKYPRYYYGFAHIDVLIKDILENRAQKLAQYGKTQYQRYMQDNKIKGMEQKGFWQHAIEV